MPGPDNDMDRRPRLLGGDGPERAERIKRGRMLTEEANRLAAEVREQEKRQREASALRPADGTLVLSHDSMGQTHVLELEADTGAESVRFYFAHGDYVEISRQGDHLVLRGAGGESIGVLGIRAAGSNVLKVRIVE